MESDPRLLNFEADAGGVHFVARRERLTPGCMSEEEVDLWAQSLRSEIDIVAARMKDSLRKQKTKPLFDY